VLGSGRVSVNRRRLICAAVDLLSDNLIVYRSKQSYGHDQPIGS